MNVISKTRARNAARLAILVLCTLALTAQPQDAPHERGSLLATGYLPRDFGGHAQSEAVLQGRDGLIHVANQRGLMTFDGQRWRRLEHPTHARVLSLALAENGDLFVGFDRDVGVVSTDATGTQHFTSWRDTLDVGLVQVPQLLSVPGAVYLNCPTGLLRVDVDGSTPLRSKVLGDARVPLFILGIAHDRVYVWTRADGLQFVDGDELSDLPVRGLPAECLVVQCLPWGARKLLLLTHKHGLYLLEDGVATRADWPINRLPLPLVGCVETADRLALATSRGLFICDRQGRIEHVVDEHNGLPDSRCRAAPIVDRDGAVWVPLSHGIGRVEAESPLELFGEIRGLRGGALAIARHRGQLYVANEDGLYRLEEADDVVRPSEFTLVAGLGPCFALLSVGADLLIAARDGLYVLRDTDTPELVLRQATCVALFPDSDDSCFLASDESIFRLVRFDGTWHRRRTLYSGPMEGVDQMVRDPADGAHHALGRLKNGLEFEICSRQGKKLFGANGSLNSYLVWRGVLRFVYSSGVYRRDADTTELVRDETLSRVLEPLEWLIAYPAAEDDDHLWFAHAGEEGIGEIDWTGEPVLRMPFARVRPTAPFALFPDAGGQMWLGTGEGNVYRYTRDRGPPRAPTQVMIRGITRDHEPVAATARELDQWNGTLRFDFALPCFDAPKRTRFRSRLIGYDTDWEPWTADPFREFTALADGHYRLDVEAREGSGRLAERATYEFSIVPQWYRTYWAATIYLLAALGLGIGFLRWRGRRARRRIDALESAQVLLRDSEGRYRALVETTEDLVWATDADFGYTYVSPRFHDALGLEIHEVSGGSLFDLVAPEDRERVRSTLSELRDAGLPFVGVSWSVRDATGQTHTIESSATPVVDDGGELTGYRGIDRDVTSRITLERQLRHAQKLEAVGRLAGGVAHDFNNLLTVMYGHTDILFKELGDVDTPSLAKTSVGEIQRTTERAARLTQQLLAFSRKQQLERKVVAPNDLIEGVRGMLQRLTRDDVEVKCALDPATPHVRIDPSGFEQVLVNLAINAADAMPNGGRLTIRTSPVEDGEGSTGVLVAVTDTGVGMHDETIQRIFEPFFTTKAISEGTGLGLAMVHGIVEQSGGRIRVQSAPGQGTTFEVFLPAVATPPREAGTTAAEPARGGDETILVCDDDEAVLKVTRAMLEHAGYNVLSATNPRTAEALSRETEARIDLVVTDVVMPGMSGPELAGAIAEHRPGLRVMFVSGYPMAPRGLGENAMVQAPYLAKPFTADELLRHVRDVLDVPARPKPAQPIDAP